MWYRGLLERGKPVSFYVILSRRYFEAGKKIRLHYQSTNLKYSIMDLTRFPDSKLIEIVRHLAKCFQYGSV